MEDKLICFGCIHLCEAVTFDTNNGILKKDYYCTEKKLVEYMNSRKCSCFANKQVNIKEEEICYLFSEEEWKAIRNGTYVGITPMPWDKQQNQ